MELVDIFKSGKPGQNQIEAVGGVGGGCLACLAAILLSHYSKQSNSRIFLCPDICKRVALYKPL